MAIINAFTGVGVADKARTLHVTQAVVAAAHPAAGANTPPRKRHRESGHHLARALKSRMATDPKSPDPWPLFLGDPQSPGRRSTGNERSNDQEAGKQSHVGIDERLREEHRA